jgi:hypothetical protein
MTRRYESTLFPELNAQLQAEIASLKKRLGDA